MGLQVDAMTEAQAASTIVERAVSHRGGQIYTINLDVLRLCRRDARMRERIGSQGTLVLADGAPLVWASRLGGSPLPERVAGSSLLFSLSERAAEAGASVFLLGGNDGAAEAAASRLTQRYPRLRVAGWHFPPFGFEDSAVETHRVQAAVGQADPDIVFVGLPFAKQVEWMPRLHAMVPHACLLGVGISLSFASGEIARAPRWVQRFGLEWLHRLVQEPRRLARRYLLHGPPTLLALVASAWRSRRAG